jgi:hypothetical protein
MAVALVRRFPNPLYRPLSVSWLPNAGEERYAALAAELAAVHDELMPAFTRADVAALRAQNRFRGAQVALILGGASIAILGSLQAALGDAATWPSIAQLVVGAVLTGVGAMQSKLSTQQRYLKQRLVAESLRGEAFLFLGSIGYPVGDEGARRALLAQRIAEIERAGGP